MPGPEATGQRGEELFGPAPNQPGVGRRRLGRTLGEGASGAGVFLLLVGCTSVTFGTLLVLSTVMNDISVPVPDATEPVGGIEPVVDVSFGSMPVAAGVAFAAAGVVALAYGTLVVLFDS